MEKQDKGSEEVRDMLGEIPELWGGAGPVNLPDAAFDAIARRFTKALKDTFTKAEIEAWLEAEAQRAEATDWADAYKFGFTQGLVAARCRMDDEIKRRRVNGEHMQEGE